MLPKKNSLLIIGDYLKTFRDTQTLTLRMMSEGEISGSAKPEYVQDLG
jgi:hypothetical protein